MEPKVRTPSAAFDCAWQLLSIYFPPADLPDRTSLDLTKLIPLPRCRVHRQQVWSDIMQALVEVVGIGYSEPCAGKAHPLHVYTGANGKGRILFVPKEFLEEENSQ